MPRDYGWTLLASLWAIVALNFGFTAYAPAVINVAMVKAIGLNREALGNMFAAYMLMSGLPGPAVAILIDRWGARWTLMLGSALILCGSLLMATIVTGEWGAVLCCGVLLGAGNITGSLLPSQSVLARWFVSRRPLVLAAVYSGAAVGGLIAAPWVDYFIQQSGTWRAGWWLISAASVIAACIALTFVHELPPDASTIPGSHALDRRPSFVTRYEWTYREAVRHPTYWLMLCGFLGASGGNTLFLAHGVAHFQDLGHSARFAAWSVGVMTASGLAGKGLLALLGDRFDPRFLLAAFLATYGVGLSMVVNANAAWQALFAVTCLGIGFGGGFVTLMTVVSNYYGIRAFPALAGTMTAIPTAVSAFLSGLAGSVFDSGMGYGVSFYTVSTWCFAGAATLLLLRPPTRAVTAKT